MPELRLVLRTPREVLLDAVVRGVRLPTPSGQVGVRAGAEPWVSALAPGLIVVDGGADGRRFAGSAGGIVRHDGGTLTLFTPFAAVGEAQEVLDALATAQADDAGELAALRSLAELEDRITAEVRAGRAQGEVR